VTAAQYKYDVFISYSHRDHEWVTKELLPSLEAADLKVCIDFRDFEVGVPCIVNMERAVENSSRTIFVLTPEWIQSEWTDFESLLISGKDPAGRRGRLIPLLLKQCVPPPRIAMLTYADFTKIERHLSEMERLLKTLKGDEASVPPDPLNPPNPGLPPPVPPLPGNPPLPPLAGKIEPSDEMELADLLRRSGRASYSARQALCVQINVSSDDLSFIDSTAPRDFALQLVNYLVKTGNRQAICQLCDALTPALQGEYALKLKNIRVKAR
jgi:hypothetical protein